MGDSRNSRPLRSSELLAAFLLVAALSAAALVWFHQSGCTLYYGDAEAHLNMARRILDSRTPGPFQIGAVWLPLPHILMLPLVRNDGLWRSGLAGAIPSAACFIMAAMFLFAAARRIYGDTAAAATTLSVFALSPNLLYLQSAPMTEPAMLAAVCALLYFAVRYRETQSALWAVAAGLATAAASLTRYEGWFLIPCATLFFLLAARRRRFLMAVVVGAIASLGPLAWLAHNWWYWGDFLEFYRGPYSAMAILERTMGSRRPRYRGEHDWRQAWLYYREVVRLALGGPAVWLGLAGMVAAAFKRALWPLALLVATPAFYVWSMHSGGEPIFMPHLWPYTYYNTRFGVTALPALALAAGALMPSKFRAPAGLLVVLLLVVPWVLTPWPEGLICWKESQVNSEGRRAWTREAAAYLRDHYRPGTGILMRFGDLAGVLREAGIPLRESLHEDNVPAWQAAVASPVFCLQEEWALAIAGDPVDTAIAAAKQFERVKTIALRGQPDVHIYRRN